MKIARARAAVSFAAVAALAASACSSSEPAHPLMPAPTESSITFSETVEPILQQHCQTCHHTGGIAPFSLVSYEDAVKNAPLVREKVLAREMPPWGAFDSPDCKMQHKLKDDLRLSDEDIAKIATWVENGTPLGDVSKRPPPAVFANAGLVDKTHSFVTTPHVVAGSGIDDFRCFPIDPGFTEDTWVGGSNVVPGDPTVVHHVLVFVDPNSESPALAAGDPAHDGSYSCFGGPGLKAAPSLLLAWAPGVPPTYYGDDSGIKVPKGAKLVMQIHYHPHTDASATDQTGFELKALPGKPSFVSQILLVGNADTSDPKKLIHLVPPSADRFLIPAGAEGHVEAMEVNIPEKIGSFTFPPTNILAAGAHMHWAGVNMKIEVTRKNPTEGQPEHECVLSTPKYDFNWQRGYRFDEDDVDKLPLISPGDTIRFTCTYDNSTKNKYVVRSLAEDHTSLHDIHLGETTRDEMCLGAIVGIRRATAADF